MYFPLGFGKASRRPGRLGPWGLIFGYEKLLASLELQRREDGDPIVGTTDNAVSSDIRLGKFVHVDH